MGKASKNKHDRSDRSSRSESGRSRGEGQHVARRRGPDPKTSGPNQQRAQRTQAKKREQLKPQSRHSEQRYKCNKEKVNGNHAPYRSRRVRPETREPRQGRSEQQPQEHLGDEFDFDPSGTLKFDPRAGDNRSVRNLMGSLLGSLKFSIGGIESNPVPRRDSVAAPKRDLSFSKFYVRDFTIDDDDSTEWSDH